MKSKILLVDGHNLLFRAYFGMPYRFPGKEGFSLHGVVGFMGMLVKIMREVNPSHALVVFDSGEPCFRSEIAPEYKQNRIQDYSEMEEDPFTQLPGIKKVLDFLDLKHLEVSGVEADDIIAAYALDGEGDDVVIASSDSDFFQLVSEDVKVYLPGKYTKIFGVKEVQEKYGVFPKQIVDYKSLTGDSTDNIKGISGIGPVTAKNIINEFESIENLLENLHLLSDKVAAKITPEKEILMKNKSLIRLQDDVALPIARESLGVQNDTWSKMRTMEILKELELV